MALSAFAAKIAATLPFDKRSDKDKDSKKTEKEKDGDEERNKKTERESRDDKGTKRETKRDADKDSRAKEKETKRDKDAGGEEKEKHKKKSKHELKDKDKEKDNADDSKRKKKEKKKGAKTVIPKASNAHEEMLKWANATLDKGIRALQEEFAKLKTFVPEKNEAVAFSLPSNQPKNRYKDIICLENSRVKLNGDPSNDYIHANYVSTAIATHRFICTQAPMDNTISDFWRMMVQEESEVILMLCNIVEANQKKCAEYYPQKVGQKLTFGDFTIKAVKQSQLAEEPSVEITLLAIKMSGAKKLLVKHYHWTNWPDKGVPEVSLTIMNMLTAVRGSKKPIVVHCSAGIGRTGTVVSVEFLLERMQFGQHCQDTMEVMKDIRRQRSGSVQTEMQYLYVHRIMLHYFLIKNTIENSQRLLEFYDDYDAALKKAIEMETAKKAARAAAAAAAGGGESPMGSPITNLTGAVATGTTNQKPNSLGDKEGHDAYFMLPASETGKQSLNVNETQWMPAPP